MKKYIILIFSLFLFSNYGFTQVQATIKPGSVPNSVYITFKSATTLTAAKFSTFQFAVGIPTAVSAGITSSVTSFDPLMGYSPLETTEMQDGTSYKVFSYSGDGLQSGSGTTYNAGVEYNYAEVFFMGASITLNDVRLVQLPDGGTAFQDNFYVADKGADVTNTTAQFYSSTPANVSNDGLGYSGSSYVKIGAVVLPVKFTGFNVAKKDKDALLTWQIENETSQSDSYEIERSTNGTDFVKVDEVAAKNNGSSTNTYTFTDANFTRFRASGVVYYRIKQMDKDGRFTLTNIRTLRLDTKNIAVNVYPNPIKNIATVSFDLLSDADVKMTINDASGKQVQTIPLQLFKGVNTKKIDMSTLAAGSYTLSVNTGSEIQNIGLVKVN